MMNINEQGKRLYQIAKENNIETTGLEQRIDQAQHNYLLAQLFNPNPPTNDYELFRKANEYAIKAGFEYVKKMIAEINESCYW